MLSYKCKIEGVENTNQYEELIKIFLRPDEYEINNESDSGIPVYSYRFNGDKDEVKRKIYQDLVKITSKIPKWGILTGIRPVKLTGEIYQRLGSIDETKKYLEDKYLLSREKQDLVAGILDYQLNEIGRPSYDSLSLYIGIPFCPTRCLYCSFTSNQVPDSEIERYLEALLQEIKFAGHATRNDGFDVESVYIGGGTPTTLSSEQLDRMLETVFESFDLDNIKEFTIEGGRPDTITSDKVDILNKYGIGRISINPQTTKGETLELIGRKHTVDQVYEAFDIVKSHNIKTINTDLIAGLPNETLDDFNKSLDDIIKLGATNITLHTLAVKRASRLKEMDENFNYKQEELREQMLCNARDRLTLEGYTPYYLYRQKHTSGNTENIGYCKPGEISVYNVRIMEEAQSILALGAGGISKIYFPEENRLERVPNVSNYEIYIERIDEMIKRKKKGFFGVRNIGGK